jgi:putative transposase
MAVWRRGRAERGDVPFRSWQPVHQRAFQAPDDRARHQRLEEPVGKVWDNAAMESFFSSLKTERTSAKTCRTRDQADVFDYINASIIRGGNPRRRRLTMGHLSPIDFEKHAALA